MKKNFCKYLLLFVLTLFGVLSIYSVSVKADSGWDTDYDYGGGGGYDYDYDYGDSNYSYSSGGGSVFGSIVTFIIIIIVIASIYKNKGKKTITPSSQTYTYMSEEDIKALIPDFNKNEFLDKAYKTYLDVQDAWTNYNFDKLRNLLSDELFNTYNMQLRALKAKKQKNIMEGFNKTNMDITSVVVENDKVTLKSILDVEFADYVVDKDDKVVRGNKNDKMHITYELTFISTINKEKLTNCPNCGAPIKKDNASDKCEYCNAVIVKSSYDWVLAKKENKNQWRV